MYNGKKIMIALNHQQASELRGILGLEDTEKIEPSAIKRYFNLPPDNKKGRTKGALNKNRIADSGVDEIQHIHPLAALWLTRNGYSYIHEYTMPDYGRVDFYATHPDGHTLLVEAKGKNLAKVITQLAGYGVQIPKARLSIAVLSQAVTSRLQDIAMKYSIGIIPLELDGDNAEK